MGAAVVTTPDGGAWTFLRRRPRRSGYGDRRLYASRFDPELMVWLPAQSLAATGSQFGATATVDSKGVVHLAYPDRQPGSESSSRLVYRRFTESPLD